MIKSKQDKEAARELIMIQSSMSLQKAVAGDQISLIRKESERDLAKAITQLILNLAASFNIGKNMNELQVFETTMLLIEKYWYLKIEEFILVFKNAKLGTYGKLYDSLDVHTISSWFTAYETSAERMAYFEKINSKYREIERQQFDSAATAEVVGKLKSMLSIEKAKLTPKIPEISITNSLDTFISVFGQRMHELTDQELEEYYQEFATHRIKEGLSLIDKELERRKPQAS